jgi:hypothetical protein
MSAADPPSLGLAEAPGCTPTAARDAVVVVVMMGVVTVLPSRLRCMPGSSRASEERGIAVGRRLARVMTPGWFGYQKRPMHECKGGVYPRHPLSRRFLCRSWHLTRVTASQAAGLHRADSLHLSG